VDSGNACRIFRNCVTEHKHGWPFLLDDANVLADIGRQYRIAPIRFARSKDDDSPGRSSVLMDSS